MSFISIGLMILAVIPYAYIISVPMVLEQKLRTFAKNYVYVEKAYNKVKESWYDEDEKVVWVAEDGDIFNNIYVYLAAIHIESGMSFDKILGEIEANWLARFLIQGSNSRSK